MVLPSCPPTGCARRGGWHLLWSVPPDQRGDGRNVENERWCPRGYDRIYGRYIIYDVWYMIWVLDFMADIWYIYWYMALSENRVAHSIHYIPLSYIIICDHHVLIKHKPLGDLSQFQGSRSSLFRGNHMWFDVLGDSKKSIDVHHVGLPPAIFRNTRPGKPTKSYWTWPFIVDFAIKNGEFP